MKQAQTGDGEQCVQSIERVDEAHRLWKALRRENDDDQSSATAVCVPAFQQLTSKGININVTLLLSQEVCKRVAEAHIGERLAARGGDARISGKQALYIWA